MNKRIKMLLLALICVVFVCAALVAEPDGIFSDRHRKSQDGNHVADGNGAG